MNHRTGAIAAVVLILTISATAAEAQTAFKLGAAQADDGRAIAIDGSGNTFVTGRFRLTVDFDPGPGTFELTAPFGFSRYVASYDPTGALRYAFQIGGAVLAEAGIAADAAGNVYLTGAFSGVIDFDPGAATQTLTAVDGRTFVASYDPTGAHRFAINFGVNSGTLEYGAGIAVDASGNSYVTGVFNGETDFDPTAGDLLIQSEGFTDVFLASYTSSGTVRFAIGIGGTASDSGLAIALDGSGNSYVTGSFRNTVDFDPAPAQQLLTSNDDEDIFLASYTSNGGYRYALGVGGTGVDRGYGAAVDVAGNAFVTGIFAATADFDPGAGLLELTSNGNSDAFVASYDGTGALRFAFSFGDTNSDQGFAAAMDAMGNVYVTGDFRGTVDFDPGAGTQDISVFGTAGFVATYTNAGAYREAYAFTRIATGGATGRGIVVDAAGRPAVAGTFSGTVDFDPSAATSSLTSSGSDDMFFSSFFPGVLGPGSIPMTSLRATRTVDRNVLLEWDASCSLSSPGYAIYEGQLGDWDSHTAKTCNTGVDLMEEIISEAGDRYFLVVPITPTEEGSYGTDGDGVERPVGVNVCRPLQFAEVCP